MKNAMSKRVIVLVMIGSIMGTTVAQAAEVKKDESVYVTLGYTGNLEKTTVSDWIHSEEGGITVFDKSELKNIKNVKSDVEPEKNGENLIWDMDGNNLYYQGTTNKDIPLDIAIKYYYEDEEIDPEDLAGKSGKIKIEIDIKNKEYKDADINGKMRKIYTPFVVAGEVTLPNDKFKDVSVEGATTISEGNNILVAFAKMPGLSDSLELDSIPFEKVNEVKDKADILNDKKIVVEADAEEFSLGPIMITATADTSMLGDLEGAADLAEYKEKIDALQDNFNKLLDGETQIHDGIVDGYSKAKTKIADAAPRMQGMINLIKSSDQVGRANELLDDAYEAKDMPTDVLKADIYNFSAKYMNNLQILNNKAELESLKVFANQCITMKKNGQLNDLLVKYNKLVQMKKSGQINNLKEEYEMIKKLDGSGQLMKFKQGYAKVSAMKKSGQLDKLITGGKSILNNYNEINKVSQSVVSILNDKGVLLLLNDINTMESAYGKLTPETKQVLKVLASSITPENLKAINNMTDELTPVQENLKKAIDAAGGINNFVTTLRSSLATLGTLSKTLSQVDFAGINADVSNYGSAYLVLRGELMASAATGNLEAKKIELKRSVAAIYKSSPELAAQLQGAIDKFSNNLSPQAIQKDCEKAQKNAATLQGLSEGVKTLQSVTPLLNQINALTSDEAKLKAALSLLTGQNQAMANLKILANAISSLPQDQQGILIGMISNLGNVMDHIDSNKQTIDSINVLAGKYLSEDEIEKLNKYASELNNAKDLVTELQKINISSNDIPDIDLSKLNVPNVDMSILEGDIPEIDPSIFNINLGIDFNNIDGMINSGKGIADNVFDMSEKLMKMQGHLKNDEDILRVMKDSLEKDNVNEARKMLKELPEYKSQLDELNSGIQQLNDGMNQYKNEGIDVIHTKGSDALTAVDELALVKDQITQSSKDYGCFSGQDESVKGSTKFIMKTKEIKYETPKEEEEKEETTEKKGFFAWIKSLFGID